MGCFLLNNLFFTYDYHTGSAAIATPEFDIGTIVSNGCNENEECCKENSCYPDESCCSHPAPSSTHLHFSLIAGEDKDAMIKLARAVFDIKCIALIKQSGLLCQGFANSPERPPCFG